jgi:hypothetical protein
MTKQTEFNFDNVTPQVGDIAICQHGKLGKILRLDGEIYHGIKAYISPGHSNSWQSNNPTVIAREVDGKYKAV